MKDDKRRIPYNIWINVLGFLLASIEFTAGFGLIWVGYSADQMAVSGKSFKLDFLGTPYDINTYSDTPTESNWQDILCRALMFLLGVFVIGTGIALWLWYAEKHYWAKNEKQHMVE